MKKFFAAVFLFACLFLSGCRVEEMGDLGEVSRPYAGEYLCTKLILNGEDRLSQFEFVRLVLGRDGRFELSWRDPSGGNGTYAGSYALAAGGRELLFTAKGERTERTFCAFREHGAVTAAFCTGGRLICAEFSLP